MDLVFFKEMMKRETDILVNSVLAIGKEGDWNSITSLLLSFQALVNNSMQDLFSVVPQDIYRLILSSCEPKDQLSLSKTCKRFHSMKWMEPIWKRESIDQFKQLVLFSPKLFEIGIDYIGIPWIKVLECMIRPNKLGNSFRRYYYDYTSHMVGPLNGNRDNTRFFILGEIKELGTIEIIQNSGSALVIEEDCFRYQNYIGHCQNDIIYVGNDIGNESRILYEGIMVWPDGFSHSGKWNGMDDYDIYGIEPKDKIIHPKIKECLENEKCTRFSGDNGP
eukprot:TRINITY_DN1183_c0_g2_i4.p1 TRINITY_DN1183_c0_g2~~TRINITY_DN1183_c0_g2_i4.p1  ORF type:complete len:277 (+),score=40.81 TRINITY_DN1183_c0_g2_i4:33-863(+)